MESKAILSIVTLVTILIFNPIIGYSDIPSIDTTVNEKITTISVTTDKTSYKEGDIIKISGKVTNPDSVSKTSLIVKAPNGNIVSVSQQNLNYDGTFFTTLIAGGTLMNVSGTYLVVVQYGDEDISDSVNFYYSTSVDTPTQTTASMKVLGLPYYVEYTISGGKLLSIIPDTIANSLMLSINSHDNGFISVELPRKLIDAKLGNDVDDHFFVLVDNNEVEFKEKTTTFSTRTITIEFQIESKKLEIIGTHIESKQPTTYTPKTTDSVVPLLLVPNDILVNTQDSKVRVDYTVKAIDDEDGILVPVCNPLSGSYFGLGDTLVTCSAKDFAGNRAQEKFLVTVVNETQIPSWIKDVADFWCSDEIEDESFLDAISYLVENNVIIMPKTTPNSGNSGEIPGWIKNNACWWSDGTISDQDFTAGIQYLISNGIINV